MKRLLHSILLANVFLIAVSCCPIVVSAQVDSVAHRGETISLRPSTNLYLLGSFRSDSSVTNPILNSGVFWLRGDLVHYGQANLFGPTPTAGTFRFFGGGIGNPVIRSTRPIRFKHLVLGLTQSMGAGGEVRLRTQNVVIRGNLQFVSGGLSLDTNTITLFRDVSDGSTGMISENDDSYPYGDSALIVLTNNVFPIGVNNNVWGMGLTFNLQDPLGGMAPVLHRTFAIQEAGASYGSIQRVYSMRGHSNPAGFNNVTINYLQNVQLGLNPDANSLHVFISEDRGQVWRDKGGTSNATSVTSAGLPSVFSLPQNYTLVTAATSPCDVLPVVQINQVITSVTPNDTLFNITNAMACDMTGVVVNLFANGTSGGFYEWRSTATDINGNFVYQVQSGSGLFFANQVGTYWVRCTDIRGCVDSASVTVMQAPAADANFTVAAAGYCHGTNVNFVPDAAMLAGYDYQWDFGGGVTSNSYNASHTFPGPGTYPVTLTVTTDQNCTASKIVNVVIHPIPAAAFAFTAACPGSPVQFDNNSTAGSAGNLVTIDWDFGDGNTTTSMGNGAGVGGDVSHTYAAEGAYTVSIQASSNGCTSTVFSQVVNVYPVPSPAFSVSNACAGQSTVFTNGSSISDSSPLTYLWNFNGMVGPTSTAENPAYPYPAPGAYTVTLTVTSANGCTETVSQVVTVFTNPSVAFTSTNACVNNLASFVDQTPVIAGATPYTYDWNFGDGNTGNNQNEAHVYTNPGTYTVNLSLTTAAGCVGSSVGTVTIHPGPNVGFSALPGCAGTSIGFVNTSSNAVSYEWSIPALAFTSTQQNVAQSFPTAGTFPVSLSAQSANGCVGNFSGSIDIYPNPVVSLGGSISTCTANYLLDADPLNANVGGSFLWSTGATASTFNVTYNGNFAVTVTTVNGCSASDNVNVTLNSAVLPSLGPDNTFCDSTVLNAGYPGSTYLWSNGATSQTIAVSNSGAYSVQVTDQNGCIGSDAINVTIANSTPVSLGADTTYYCDGTVVTLDAGVASSYLWSTGSTASSIQVSTSGFYWVQNINGAGCSSGDTVYVGFNPLPVFDLGPATASACEQLLLNGFVPNATSSWNTGASSATLNVTSSGNYWLVNTFVSTGCQFSDTVFVTINPLPIVNLGNDTTLCSYNQVLIDAGNTGASYLWNTGATTQTINVATQGSYMVTVTDANGCSAFDDVNVVILPLFSIDLGPDRPFCTGSNVILSPNLSTTGDSYAWTYGGNPIGAAATYAVTDTGYHHLTVINAFGCVASDSVRITPSSESLFAVFLASSEIYVGDSLYCVNLSYPKPYDSEWFINSVFVSADSMPTLTFPITPNTYPVTLKVTSTFCNASLTKPILVLPVRVIDEDVEPWPDMVDITTIFNELKLYPNPNNGAFELFVDLKEASVTDISVFSLTGSLIHTERRPLHRDLLSFNFNQLSAGMYLLRVGVRNEYKTLKFIVLQ